MVAAATAAAATNWRWGHRHSTSTKKASHLSTKQSWGRKTRRRTQNGQDEDGVTMDGEGHSQQQRCIELGGSPGEMEETLMQYECPVYYLNVTVRVSCPLAEE